MEANFIELKCNDCGGTMNCDEKQQFVMCPYCGSKKIIAVSDDIKKEEILSNERIVKHKIDSDLEHSKIDSHDKKNISDTILIIALFVIILLLQIFK